MIGAASVLFLFISSTASAQTAQRENRELEQWLEDRGLDDLLLEQFESRLESTTEFAEREQIAKRLAGLYGRKLLSIDGNAQQLIDRTRELIQIYPQFESGRLRVAMLHARYLENEKLFREWFRDGAEFADKAQLEKTMRTLDGDLSSALTALTLRSEELYAAEQLSRDRRDSEQQRQMIEAEALHCQFLAGWSRYFLALLIDDDRTVLLDESERSFREFLQLDQQTILSDFDSRWFDFSSVWHVRAVSGLAAIAAARKDESQSAHLYGLIETNAVSRESREAAIRFRYLGHCYCKQFAAATNVIRNRKALQSMSREGRIRLWLTVKETMRAIESKDLEQLALTGLTRNMAGEFLVENSERVDALKSSETFESCWVRGYLEFWKSENGDASAADRANALLSKAVSLGTLDGNPADVARCRYLLAWLMLKQRDLKNAIGLFSQVADQLADVDPQLASESAWFAASTSIQAGKRGLGSMNDAWNRLERFVRQWPDSPHANTAGFEKLKIELRSMPPTDAIGRLREVPRGDQNYGAALLEVAAQNYRLWESRSNDPAAVDDLKTACDEVQSSGATSSLQKVRSNFLLINALLRTPASSNEEMESLLIRSATILNQLEDSRDTNVELLYYRLQFQQRDNDSEGVLASANKIVETGKGTRFELPALIQLAQYHDSKLAGAVTKSRQQRIEAAVDVYQKLSQRLGASVDQLKASSNARVAFSRLGELYQLAGRSVESEKIFQSLSDLFPGNAGYLRNLAASKSDRDPAASVKIWKRLAAGSEAGSDMWFESKLELAKDLGTRDRDAAIKLLKQTMQLGGDSSPQWQRAYLGTIEQLTGETRQ